MRFHISLLRTPESCVLMVHIGAESSRIEYNREASAGEQRESRQSGKEGKRNDQSCNMTTAHKVKGRAFSTSSGNDRHIARWLCRGSLVSEGKQIGVLQAARLDPD